MMFRWTGINVDEGNHNESCISVITAMENIWQKCGLDWMN